MTTRARSLTALSEPEQRRVRLTEAFTAVKIDALIVSSAANIRYLSGFTGSNGLLLVAPGAAVLFTDPRYTTQAAQETDCTVRIVHGPLHPALLQAAARRRLRRLGFEPAGLTWQAWNRINEGLPLNTSLYPAPPLAESMRRIKSASEVEAIRRSVITNSKAFERASRKIAPGITEAALAAAIEHQMRLLGAEKPAFDTIVASGPHTALPHAVPRDVAVRPKQLVLVDMGCFQAAYASDMTRMAFTGTPPPRVRRLYKAVLEAQLAACDAVRAGVQAGTVDRAARRVLRGYGYERLFIHSTGHGLGLEIHEPPRIGRRDPSVLQAGMVITIEPGAYIEGYGGIRIEDTILVTETGCEILTPTSKDLLTVP
ncbi:MAG TPA: Xaa-Pro peptidase family protein [Bryobacteraceae bacterium]|nr:Xaa-Pro peptidase family protein [Bryobacteraceae bacterium]